MVTDTDGSTGGCPVCPDATAWWLTTTEYEIEQPRPGCKRQTMIKRPVAGTCRHMDGLPLARQGRAG